MADRLEQAAQRAATVEDYRFEGAVESTFSGRRFAMRGSFVQTADSERFLFDGTLSQGGASSEIEAVNVGDDFYFRGPDIAVPRGKRWLYLSEGGPTLSMAQYFALLGEIEELEQVGSEVVRGRETDHFEAAIGIGDFLEALGGAAPEEFGDGTRVEDVDVNFGVWLDSDANVRRLELGMATAGTPERLDVSFDITGTDTGVAIEPPPPAQVAELKGG